MRVSTRKWRAITARSPGCPLTLVADEKNHGSMLTSIARAREIARTARDVLPREVWERINDLYLYVASSAEALRQNVRGYHVHSAA